MRRVSPVLIILLLLGACIPMSLVSASGESSTINTFTGGFATVQLDLQGGATNTSATIEVPRNVTFNSVSFDVEVDQTDVSPGQVWVDVDQDGTFEWEFTGTGYGDIGHQNEFYDGSEWFVYPVNAGSSSAPGILLPSTANLQSSNLEVSFSSQAGGGFFQIGTYQEVIETDIDGDGNPEPLFLLDIQSNNSTSVVWADWAPNTGITTSAPIQTCDNATSVSVGDLNGDGDEDIVAFSTVSNKACVHIANGTSYDPVLNLSLTSGLIGAKLGDINADGTADIITINAMGALSYQNWNNATWSLDTAVTQTINPNGSVGMPANLVSLHVDDFFATGTISALVMDQMGYWTLWQHFSGTWGGPITQFDDIKQNEIIVDLDGDGDLDLIGTNDQGYAFRINDGTDWNVISVQGQIELLNSTIADFDNDGNLDLMTPNPGLADGNTLTVEGNISLRTINASNVSSTSIIELQPWSVPKSLITMDMDGDGVLEQIVASGESTYGAFIGGWHSIELDADGDGSVEMSRSGYAGDSSNDLEPLSMSDDMDGIRDDLSPMIASEPSVIDAYGIAMVNFSMNTASSGIGAFNFTNLDIGYDCTFHVDGNPHASNNLTNVLNQGMTAGVGIYTVEIPVNSTDSGQISLTNIVAIHVPGAPNLSLPITPTLVLVSATPSEVSLAWNDIIEFGEDFDEFEIFRLESESAIVSLIDVYNSTRDNQTIDSNVIVGATYWYSVRSVHTFGITSNLSNSLEVTVPYPAPPAAILGTQLIDVSGDEGGVLQLTWTHSQDSFTHYDVYLETSSFSDISSLTAQSTIASTENSALFTGLTDGQEYWAAVVAVDQYGNSTNAVTSVGPSYSRNDVPNAVNLQMTTTSQTSLGSPFYLEVTGEVDGVQTTLPGAISVEMETGIGTYLISTNWDAIDINDFATLLSQAPDISGEVTFWANYSGDAGDELNRPLAAASTSSTTVVMVGANISTDESSYVLNLLNQTIVTVDLTAINPQQQPLLDGATIVWTAFNSTTNLTSTGTEQITSGSKQFIVNYSSGGTLFVNFTSPTWINVDDNSLEITIHPYGSEIEDNSTDDNETEPTPWSPDMMLDVTVDCGEVIIDPSVDQELDCTFTNPNNYSIDVSLEADGWSQWFAYILFEPLPGQSDFSLDESETNTVEIRVEILDNLSNNGLTNGMIQIDLRQGPTDYTSVADKSVLLEIQWTLIGEDPVVNPNPSENNSEQTDNDTDDETSSNTMVIVGGLGAVALIGLVVFIVLRIRNSDIEDWDEDDLDLEPDMNSERASKPLPVGVALDEFDDKTIVDESPDKPDFISEFDEDGDAVEEVEEVEEEYEEEYEEASEEDSGITVDEHGTEWYEDEVGVWWFRDAGQDDWSEFVE